jgi:phosphate transport system substrate-binding protein
LNNPRSPGRIARLLALAAALALVLPLASCARSGKNAITLAGSTSVEPFAERLAEVYMQQHPGIEISVQGGGSSAGVRACQNGICAVGMSSRELNPDEQGLTVIPIAIDAIALIVNAKNPVTGLSLEQARDIFSGRITNWRDVGGPNRPITPITREEGSGTRSSFEEKVMAAGMPKDDKGKPEPAAFAADALVQDSNGAVREVVADDPDAIGYISFGLVEPRVHALALNNIAPDEASVRSGEYPVVRRFLFLTKGEATGTAKQFIEYTLSDAGQQVLVEEGLASVK